MPLSDSARLQSTALQLAASIERMFPNGPSQHAVWDFTAEGEWADYATQEPFGSPMDRWGAFLHRGKRGGERYELFELLHEEVPWLTDLVISFARCRSALRKAIRAAPRIPREVKLYHDLFRQLRRGRWTQYGISGWKKVPSPCGEFIHEITFRIHAIPPNVALVREMARVVAVEVAGEQEENEGEVFVPSAVQAEILRALDGKALRTDALIMAARTERRQLFRHMAELKERGLVLNHRKIGFYRPDRLPPQLPPKTARHPHVTK